MNALDITYEEMESGTCRLQIACRIKNVARNGYNMAKHLCIS